MEKDASGVLPSDSASVGGGLDSVRGNSGSGSAHGIRDLPSGLLLLVLRRVSRASALGGPLHFALVCRRFAAARFRIAVLLVKAVRGVSGPDLASELQVYQGPTTLKLQAGSVNGLRALWRGLATQSPSLRGIAVDDQRDTCLQCEGHCECLFSSSPTRNRDSQLCARHGQASAWWAFSGPFLRAHQGLRSLSIRGSDHASRQAPDDCLECCLCFRGPGSAVSLPELQSTLSSLKHLNLDTVDLLWAKDWLSVLPPLKSLCLRHAWDQRQCENASSIDISPVLSMTSLTSLSLDIGVTSLLGKDFRRLTNLKHLHLARVANGDGFHALVPESIWALTSLRSLRLDHFGPIRERELRRLVCLKELKLWGMVLECLPGSLRALESLGLFLFCKLERFEACGSLRSLKFSLYEERRLPAGLGRLTGLTNLQLLHLDLAKLPSGFGRLVGLKRLHISFCDRLKRLPADLPRLASLTDLSLGQLPQVKELPHDFGRLEALRSLKIECCFHLRKLPSDFSLLTSLTNLELEELKALEELPSMTCGRLTKLTLSYLERLRSSLVPGLAVGPPNEDSSIQGGGSPGLGGFQYLESLKVECCGALRVTPEHLYKLSSLQHLTLRNALGPGEIDEGFLRGIGEVKIEGQARESADNIVEDDETEEVAESDSEDEEED